MYPVAFNRQCQATLSLRVELCQANECATAVFRIRLSIFVAGVCSCSISTLHLTHT